MTTERFQETITPAIAKVWLRCVPKNQRNIINSLVDRYASDMKAGRWLATGEPIQFDVDGGLINGQHRLSAIVKSGVAQTFYVVRGLDPSAIYAIDTGKGRSAACLLSMQGHENAKTMAGFGRAVVAAREGTLLSGRNVSPTQQELFAVLDDIGPDGERAVKFATSNHSTLTSDINLALAFYVGSRTDIGATKRYLNELVTGENISKTSPAFMVRDRLIASKTARRGSSTSLTGRQKRYLVLSGLRWVLTNRDKPGKYLRVPGRRGKAASQKNTAMSRWVAEQVRVPVATH